MQKTVKVALSDDFLRAFAAIPRDRQQSVVKFMATFRQNPMSPGINYEKINDATDPRMRSVRIGIDYRGIVLKPDQGDVYCLLWVDKHDDAYDWARRHKVAIHPEIGTIQVLESSHGESITAAKDQAAQEGLFASLKDRELLRLGVPQERLQQVRSIVTAEELRPARPDCPMMRSKRCTCSPLGSLTNRWYVNAKHRLRWIPKTSPVRWSAMAAGATS